MHSLVTLSAATGRLFPALRSGRHHTSVRLLQERNESVTVDGRRECSMSRADCKRDRRTVSLVLLQCRLQRTGAHPRRAKRTNSQMVVGASLVGTLRWLFERRLGNDAKDYIGTERALSGGMA